VWLQRKGEKEMGVGVITHLSVGGNAENEKD